MPVVICARLLAFPVLGLATLLGELELVPVLRYMRRCAPLLGLVLQDSRLREPPRPATITFSAPEAEKVRANRPFGGWGLRSFLQSESEC